MSQHLDHEKTTKQLSEGGLQFGQKMDFLHSVKYVDKKKEAKAQKPQDTTRDFQKAVLLTFTVLWYTKYFTHQGISDDLQGAKEEILVDEYEEKAAAAFTTIRPDDLLA